MLNEQFKSKFNVGDIFAKRGTRDSETFKVIEVNYRSPFLEPEYHLKGMRVSYLEIELGEAALEELYYLCKSNNKQ